jgi:hypothetical protein
LGTCVGGGHSPVLPDVIAPRYAKPGWSGNRSDWLVSNGGRLGRHPHPTHRRMRFFRLLLLISFCASARALSAQSAPDLIRGHVTDDSSNVVAGAAVFVTRGPDRAVKQTVTDSSGRYSLTFENGTGDWLVAVNGAGYKTARRRVQRVDAETAFTADFVLSRPASSPPSLAGDISALAATMPGITVGANGLSMLGASSESNLTTLNGMSMAGGSLPRAARTETHVTGATFDPTRRASRVRWRPP